MRKIRGSLLLALVCSGLFLFLALRGIDWQEVFDTARQARWEYLVAGGLISSLVYFLRGLRWRVLLSADRWLPTFTVFWATMLGYLGNNFLPARAGELIRSAALGRRCGISSSFVLATALTERIMDVIALLAFGAAAIVWLGGQSNVLLRAVMPLTVVSAIGIIGIIASPHLERPLRWTFAHAPLPAAWLEPGLAMLQQFLTGLKSLRDAQRALSFAGLTGLIWTMDALGATLTGRALNLPLDIFQAVLLLAALGLASAIPATPGYVGTYQFVAVTILPLFGFTRSQAFTFILVIQASNYAVVTLWGLLGLWRLADHSGAPRTSVK